MSYTYKTKGELLAATVTESPQRRDDRAEYIRAAIASGIAELYRSPVFVGGFDKFACFGDSITCEYGDWTLTARLEFDQDRRIDDTDCFPEEYSEEMFGEDTPENRACFETALEARRAWLNNEWHYVGVVVSVAYRGVMLDEHAASLWGIECNYPGADNSYLTVVAHELAEEALKVGKARLETLHPTAEIRAAREESTEGVDPYAVLENIAAQLDGQVWDSDTLDTIACIMRAAGYEIRDEFFAGPPSE